MARLCGFPERPLPPIRPEVLLIPAVLAALGRGFCGTFEITHTRDSGAGSLREALTAANGHAGPDTLLFRIPKTDPGFDAARSVWTLLPLSELPELADRGTEIDGASQFGMTGLAWDAFFPVLVLDGASAGATSGLTLSGNGHSVRNLVLHRFTYRQVYVTGDSNRVTGCRIGTDANGIDFLFGSGGGVLIESGSHNVIGGVTAPERNVISGNAQPGVEITYRSAGNRVLGNYIGIRADGFGALPNDRGVLVSNGATGNTIGPGNVVSGNRQNGIALMGPAVRDNTVAGNLVGLDPSGFTAWGNGDDGILLFQASRNTVGGPAEADRNVVSGNAFAGISLRGESSDSNAVLGNYVGTDASGRFALGNGESGIAVSSGAAANRVGGTLAGEGNIVSGNLAHGIQVHGLGSDGNTVSGNRIGTDASGLSAVPNFLDGVAVMFGPRGGVIGPSNTIAFNRGHGVSVAREGTTGHTVTQNDIHSNGRAGIRLTSGGNEGLDAPQIQEPLADPDGTVRLSGYASPGGWVEVFADSSDEGEVFLGGVTADGAGGFEWTGRAGRPMITATVTDSAGNTSAFSSPHKASAAGPEGPARGRFRLLRNFPNPFNPRTTIGFETARAGRCRVAVFDLLGREAALLADGRLAAGPHTLVFDASGLASGVYLVVLEAEGSRTGRKIVKLD